MSENVGQLILKALILFIVTNADDLIVLMNFFTQVSMKNSSMEVRHVFIGQYVGFIILLLICLIGYFIAFVIPVEIIGFFGFFPIFLGIKLIIELIIELYKKRHGTIDDILPSGPVSTVQLEMFRYQNDTNGKIIYEIKKTQEENLQVKSSPKSIFHNLFRSLFHVQTFKVISITLANSADNISIYTPLFAQALKWQIIVYIVVFIFMVLIWLIISYYFINYKPILNVAQKYSSYIVPVVFIAIGIYIVISSECILWLIKAIETKSFKNG